MRNVPHALHCYPQYLDAMHCYPHPSLLHASNWPRSMVAPKHSCAVGIPYLPIGLQPRPHRTEVRDWHNFFSLRFLWPPTRLRTCLSLGRNSAGQPHPSCDSSESHGRNTSSTLFRAAGCEWSGGRHRVSHIFTNRRAKRTPLCLLYTSPSPRDRG